MYIVDVETPLEVPCLTCRDQASAALVCRRPAVRPTVNDNRWTANVAFPSTSIERLVSNERLKQAGWARDKRWRWTQRVGSECGHMRRRRPTLVHHDSETQPLDRLPVAARSPCSTQLLLTTVYNVFVCVRINSGGCGENVRLPLRYKYAWAAACCSADGDRWFGLAEGTLRFNTDW